MFGSKILFISGIMFVVVGLTGGCGSSDSKPREVSEFEQFVSTAEKLGGGYSELSASTTKTTYRIVSFLSFNDRAIAKLPEPPFPFGLEFSGTDVRSRHLKALVRFKNLDYLDISYTGIDNSELQSVGQLQNLQWLELGETKITDAGLKELQTLNHLQVLDLTRTNISDDGLKSLTELENLKELNLGGTKVTDEGIKYLKEMKKLTHLTVWGTKITEAGKRELHNSLPNLVSLE